MGLLLTLEFCFYFVVLHVYRLAAYMDVTAQLFHGVPIVYSTAAIGYVRTRAVPNVLRALLGFVSRMVAGGGALFLVVIRGQGTNSFVRRKYSRTPAGNIA
jgi:hypothetical protein